MQLFNFVEKAFLFLSLSFIDTCFSSCLKIHTQSAPASFVHVSDENDDEDTLVPFNNEEHIWHRWNIYYLDISNFNLKKKMSEIFRIFGQGNDK